MKTVSAKDIVRLWELCAAQPRAQRITIMLRALGPELATEQMLDMTLGESTLALLRLREALFGTTVAAFAACPNCGAATEFEFDSTAVWAGARNANAGRQTIEAEGVHIEFRPLTLADVQAIDARDDSARAKLKLVARCVREARRDGTPLAADDLPPEAIALLSAELARCDPAAETLLDATCPACGSTWEAYFDMAEFLWAELAALAKRLLREVHELAVAYGWRENDILEMSSSRRVFYLEMVNA